MCKLFLYSFLLQLFLQNCFGDMEFVVSFLVVLCLRLAKSLRDTKIERDLPTKKRPKRRVKKSTRTKKASVTKNRWAAGSLNIAGGIGPTKF